MALQTKTIIGSTNNSNWTFKLVVTENSTSIANNTSSVTVTAYIGRASSASYMYGASISCSVGVTGCSNQTISYSNSGRVDIAGGGWLNIGSKTFTVPHNADGTKTVTISANFSNNVSPSSGSASDSMPLTKIARYSVISSADNFNDEGNPTMKFTNPSNGYFSLRAKIEAGGNTQLIIRDLSKTATSCTFNLTDSERNTLRNLSKNSNTLSVRFTICCMNGNTELSASYLDRTMTIVNANPIFDTYIYEDVNSETIALTGNSSSIIKGKSILKATILANDKAIAQKNATMSYYQIDNVKSNYSDTSDVILEVNNYDKSSISLQAVDSRGNSTTIVQNIANFIEYENIVKDNFSLTRSDNGVGKFVTLSFNGTFWNNNFGNTDNELTISYKYKKTTNTEYTIGTTIIIPDIDGNNFSFNNLIAGDTDDNGFEINDSYDITVVVSDKLSVVTYAGIIGAGKPAIAVYGNKASIGDKYDTNLGGTQLWGDIYLNREKLNNKIVCDIILEDYTNLIEINNLDLNADGGEYEITMYHSGTTLSDTKIRFNDLDNGYYQTAISFNGTATTSDGTLTYESAYRPGKDSIYWWMPASTSKLYPATLTGKFFKQVDNRIAYSFKNECSVSGKQWISFLTGVNDRENTNLKSLKFFRNSGEFNPGTRIIIRRR